MTMHNYIFNLLQACLDVLGTFRSKMFDFAARSSYDLSAQSTLLQSHYKLFKMPGRPLETTSWP